MKLNWKTVALRAAQFLVSLAVAGAAAVLADPGFRGYIARHPTLAVLVPVASAVLHSLATNQPWQISIQRKAAAQVAASVPAPSASSPVVVAGAGGGGASSVAPPST